MAIVRTAKGTAAVWEEFDPTPAASISSVTLATGSSIIVRAIARVGTGDISCTWNGLALTRDLQVDDGNIRVAIFSKHNVTGATGNVVATVSSPDLESGLVITAEQVTGLAASSTLDKTANASGISGSPSSGDTATTAQADEYLAGAIGRLAASAGGGSWSGSFTQGQGASDGVLLDLEEGYRIVAATGAYAAAKTGVTSSGWVAAIATYKAAELVVTPDAAVATASAPTPTIERTVSPGAAVATASASSLIINRTVIPDAAVATASVPDPISAGSVVDSFSPTKITSMAEGVATFLMRGSGTLGDATDETGETDITPFSYPTGTGVLSVSQNILGGNRPDWAISHVIFGAHGVMTQDGSYLSNLRFDISGGSYPLLDSWEDIRPYTIGAAAYFDRCRNSRSAPVTSRPAGGPWTWLDLLAIPSATIKMDHANIVAVGHFAEIYVSEIYIEAYGPLGSRVPPIRITGRAGNIRRRGRLTGNLGG